MEQLWIPAGEGNSEYIEKKSRFLGLVLPVTTEAEARAQLEAVKKREYDARHNCWAYVLHTGQKRYSDDGEPQGTAGQPILNVLEREGVQDVLCVVTRYFGGILLGAGGLCRAYTKAAKDALDDAGISELRPWSVLRLDCPYALFERVKLEADKRGGLVRDADYGAQIALTISRGLRLNQDLAEAAAYGHDLGHTPFGHAGEKALSSMMEKPFRHNEQSLRVVDKLERGGTGLNLTYEVRMGILGHTGDFIPETLEGQIVRTSDRIAYINHDIDDAMRAGILTEDDIPPEIAEILGHSHSQRINTLVENMIDNTIATGTLGMQPEIAQAMDRLRTFMFARVYTNPVAKGEETKAKDMLCRLFEYYMRRPEKLPADFLPQLDFDGMERIVCDYIAGMTDRYAVYKYSVLFIPTTWQMR